MEFKPVWLMAIRLRLKWAIVIVGILAFLFFIPPLMAGNPPAITNSRLGSAFGSWAIISIIILAIGIWDERGARKDGEK